MSFKAAIFDLDGVITSTAHLHERAWRETLAQVPVAWAPGDYQGHFAGRKREDGARSWLAANNVDTDALTVPDFCEQKNARYLALLETEGVSVNAEMLARICLYNRVGTKIAVASSSKNARRVLELANLWPLTDCLVDGNDVERLGLPPKPAPNIFIYAADKLGVPYDQCIVFEDSAEAVAKCGPAKGVLVRRAA